MDSSGAKRAIHAIRELMEENRDHLIELDAAIGDGDLGLTMTRAFSAADDGLATLEEPDVGKVLARAGMIMADAAPSTMGTLIATGFMRGGKAIRGKEHLAPEDIAAFFRAFSDGLMERGKSKPGEKTVVDVIEPVAVALAQAPPEFTALAAAGVEAATAGLEATRDMVAQRGRAAVFRDQTRGRQDPGATAGALVVRGFLSALPGR